MKRDLSTISALTCAVLVACGSTKPDEPALDKLPANAAQTQPVPPAPEPPHPPPRIAIGDCVAGKVAFESGPRPITSTGDRAGEHDPLGTRQAELMSCVEGKGAGQVVVELELELDKSQHPTHATVFGGDPAAHDCIAKVATTIAYVPVNAAVMRCAFAYGNMDEKEVPSITITDQAIDLAAGSAAQAHVATTDQDLAPITTGIAKYLAQATSAQIIARGPVLVHADRAVPMRVIERVLRSVEAAGAEPMLVDDAVWRGGLPEELPLPPVPAGGGDGWVRSRHIAAGGIAFHLGLDAMKVRAADVTEPVEGMAGYSEKLQALATSPRFRGRNDIAISADDDVSYENVITAIGVASTHGFTQWSLAAPR